MFEKVLSKEEIEELNRKAYETCAWEITSEAEDEKAIKKIKAWERLKEKGFRFKGWRTADLGADKYYFVITAEADDACKDDLDICFGGKE